MILTRSESQPHWLLVRTKPKQEVRTCSSLSARGVESYCPRILEPKIHSWEPAGPVPMFPGYAFARLVVAQGFAVAEYCSGGAGLVRFGDGFGALEDAAVEALRAHEGERGYVEMPRRDLKPGHRVRVAHGSMAGLEGVVAHYMPSTQRVRVLLSLAWSGRPTELDARMVRRV